MSGTRLRQLGLIREGSGLSSNLDRPIPKELGNIYHPGILQFPVITKLQFKLQFELQAVITMPGSRHALSDEQKCRISEYVGAPKLHSGSLQFPVIPNSKSIAAEHPAAELAGHARRRRIMTEAD